MQRISRRYETLCVMIGAALFVVGGRCGEAQAQIACGSATAPFCDGACPAGQDCEEQMGACVCQPTTNLCGVDAGPPLCYGLCPLSAPICADIAGVCQCVGPTPTPTATATAVGPTATPTVTPTATAATVTPTAGGPTATPTPATSPTPACAATPISPCRTPAVGQKAFLQIKKYDPSNDGKDRLIWKWLKGAATSKADFGNPLASTSYVLCAYDGGSNLILSSVAIGGDSCEGVPCWQDKPKGFNYKDKDKSPNGPQQILLKEGPDGKAQIIVRGKGSDLDPPSPPLAQPVTVQLVNTDGLCWGAVYSAPALKNIAGSPGQFKDKAD